MEENMARLDDETISTICYLVAQYPQTTPSKIIEFVYNFHRVEITAKNIEKVIVEEKDEIDKFRVGGISCVQKALKLCDLPYAPMMDRIRKLGEIVDLGVNGYQEEKASNRGDVVLVEQKNLPASLEALKQIHNTMSEIDTMDDEEYEQPVGIHPELLSR